MIFVALLVISNPGILQSTLANPAPVAAAQLSSNPLAYAVPAARLAAAPFVYAAAPFAAPVALAARTVARENDLNQRQLSYGYSL